MRISITKIASRPLRQNGASEEASGKMAHFHVRAATAKYDAGAKNSALPQATRPVVPRYREVPPDERTSKNMRSAPARMLILNVSSKPIRCIGKSDRATAFVETADVDLIPNTSSIGKRRIMAA